MPVIPSRRRSMNEMPANRLAGLGAAPLERNGNREFGTGGSDERDAVAALDNCDAGFAANDMLFRGLPSFPCVEADASSSSADAEPEAEECLEFPQPLAHAPTPTESSRVINDPALHQVEQIFGAETVLVPVGAEQSAQMVGKPKALVTLGQTKAPQFQETLTKNAIAVQLGGSSGNLCAILAKTETARREFLSANPPLASTLITSGPAGFSVFVRVTDLYPASKASEKLSWLADGMNVVVVDRNAAGRYSVVNPIPVVTVPFASIRWPAEFEGPIRFGLVAAQYGSASFPHKTKGLIANEYFWGAYLALELKVRFAPASKQFCIVQGEETWIAMSEEEVSGRVARAMIGFAQSPKFAFLLPHCNPPGVKRIMTAMRSVACLTLPPVMDELEEFVSGHLEASRGSNLTSLELYLEHERQARATGRVPFPQTVFFRRIPPLIYKHFRVRRCKRVRRGTTWQRGFNCLRFKAAAGQEETRGEGPIYEN